MEAAGIFLIDGKVQGAGFKPVHPDGVAVDGDTCTEGYGIVDGAGRGRLQNVEGHNIDIL